MDIQDELQTLYTSGTVFHTFLGEKLPDWKAAAALVRKIAENYKLPYYTISPTYSVCRDHGYISGEHFTCPTCGQKTEVYSRITGYYRPVQNWNDGKAQEYKERKTYEVSKTFSSGAPKNNEAASVKTEPETKTATGETKGGVLLFATATCPNCKVAATLLDKAGIVFTKLIADEHADLVAEFGIKQAPTLTVIENGAFQNYRGVSDIKKYIESQN